MIPAQEIHLPQGFSSPGLWQTVWKLLALRLLILVNNFRRARLRQKAGMIFLGLLFLGFLGFVFFLSWTALKFLRVPELAELTGDLTSFLESVPVIIVGGAFLGVLLTSFGLLLQALYLAGDMDFLLSKPVPIRAVFIAKLLQAILPNFGLICCFSLPVLYGLGASAGYSPLYYPLVLLVLSALALAASGISSLLVMGAVRIFPARRVAEVLGFIGAVLSIVCSQSGQLANMSDFSAGQVDQAFGLVRRFDAAWSPLAWAGRSLVYIGQGEWLPGLGLLTITLGLAGLIFAVALVTSERLYYSGWASIQNKAGKKKATRRARPAAWKSLSAFFEGWVPAAVRAIVVKDWLVLRRDLRNMSQLVTPLIIGIIYSIMLLRSGGEAPAGRGEAPAWFMEILTNLSVYFSVGLSLFVGWMLLGRLAGMGFSQEGRSYWVLKSAPISIVQLIAAKFMVAYLPVLVLCWTFLLVTWLLQGAALSTLLFSLPVVALCIAGNTGINLAFGIAGANLAWEDPRQMQRSSSSCLSALVTTIYLPVSLLLFFGPPVAAAIFSLPVTIGQAVGLALGGGFSLACAVGPPWMVHKRVGSLGE